MAIHKATRQKARIRLGLSAVSGGGKTYSALLIAYGMCGDWNKVYIVDSENGSADLYAHMGDYNVNTLLPPFSPERYIAAIKECEKAGAEVIIVDSITQEWNGKGGCLEIVESFGGKYQDWAKVTPRHQAFIDAILHSPCHVITTVRRKQDYEMVKVDGKIKVEKGGLAEITRADFEYDLTANIELDTRHNATASKDRTGLFMGKPSFVPTVATGELIRDWCESGVDAPLSPPEPPLETVTTQPRMTINKAMELVEHCKNAIKALQYCSNEVELSGWKKAQLIEVLNNDSVKAAANQRYTEIINLVSQ